VLGELDRIILGRYTSPDQAVTDVAESLNGDWAHKLLEVMPHLNEQVQKIKKYSRVAEANRWSFDTLSDALNTLLTEIERYESLH
jgi:hypothetical protein